MSDRQRFYIQALETIPNLSLHYGHFLQSKPWMRPVTPPPAKIQVVKMEEKGSDVNIATHMLVDAFQQDCDQLFLITNDSDLAEPTRIINKTLNIPVGIGNPHTQDTADCQHRLSGRPGNAERAHPSSTLRKMARFAREIKEAHLIAAQFPNSITDANGDTIHKPPLW